METVALDRSCEEIPSHSIVVFDWDNTLKVTSADRKHIRSGLIPEKMRALARAKRCICYIISAIRPTRMNLDTLLFEVNKLQLKHFFCPECQQEGYTHDTCTHDLPVVAVSRPYTYVSWGRVVICEYDKAEVFLTLLQSAVALENRIQSSHDPENAPERYGSEKPDRPIYFFDDEEINILNFRNIVKNSNCFLVQHSK